MHTIKSTHHGHVMQTKCEYCGYEKTFMNQKPQDIRVLRCPLCKRISKPVDKTAEWVGYHAGDYEEALK